MDSSSPEASCGACSNGIINDEMVVKLTQPVSAGVSTTVNSKSFGLDPSLRLPTMSDSTGGVELRKTVNHHADGSDSSSWIASQTRPDAATGWSSSRSRNVVGPGSGLVMIQSQSGVAKIQLANLHGDVVPTLDGAPYFGLARAYVERRELIGIMAACCERDSKRPCDDWADKGPRFVFQ